MALARSTGFTRDRVVTKVGYRPKRGELTLGGSRPAEYRPGSTSFAVP